MAVIGVSGCRATKAAPSNTDSVTRDDLALGTGSTDPERRGILDAATADTEGEGRARPPPARWAMWPMPNAPSSGLPNPQSYDSSFAGAVLDRVTGLMWQRRVDPGNTTFEEANAKCHRLDMGGYRDWRLPSRIELVSILDLAETQPSIDREAFPRTPPDWFWSSSVVSDSPTEAWYVYFYFGYPNIDERRSPFRARCVRTEKPPSFTGDPDAHYEVGSASVRDVATRLTWQRGLAPRTLAFEDAVAYCAHLNLDRHKDWRLPSMPELVTLVDERASKPAIDRKAFPGAPTESFWTSSHFGPAEAWYVYFDHGSALYGLLKGMFRVRCVR